MLNDPSKIGGRDKINTGHILLWFEAASAKKVADDNGRCGTQSAAAGRGNCRQRGPMPWRQQTGWVVVVVTTVTAVMSGSNEDVLLVARWMCRICRSGRRSTSSWPATFAYYGKQVLEKALLVLPSPNSPWWPWQPVPAGHWSSPRRPSPCTAPSAGRTRRPTPAGAVAVIASLPASESMAFSSRTLTSTTATDLI